MKIMTKIQTVKDWLKKIPIAYKACKFFYISIYGYFIRKLYLPKIEAEKNTIFFVEKSTEFSTLPSVLCCSLSNDNYCFNSHYGVSKIIKEYAGIPIRKRIRATIEHGLYLDTFFEPDIKFSEKGIITFSNYRKKILSYHTDKQVIPVGPYIHYADLIETEKLLRIKEKLGKIFLFFPSHSSGTKNEAIRPKFSHMELLRYLKKISKGFDSVLVCFFWLDINSDIVSIYSGAGFQCVTAGHTCDWNFLKRLKSLIYIADVTGSNNIGTHIGYCIYMGKPHWLFSQEVKFDIPPKFYDREAKGMTAYYSSEAAKELKLLFEEHTWMITDKQYDICNFLWGFDQVKTKQEMNSILLSLI